MCSGACGMDVHLEDGEIVKVEGTRLTPDYENTQCIILWGHNPQGTAENGLYVGQMIDAKERGAKLIVIDPVFTNMAAKADIWGRI